MVSQSESSNVEANQALADCLDTDAPAASSAAKEHLPESEEDPHAIGEHLSGSEKNPHAIKDKERLSEVKRGETFSAPFCIFRCRGKDLRFARDEEQTLCINIADLLTVSKCKVDYRFEGCGGRTLFYLKPDVRMTRSEGLGVYATSLEVRSIMLRCNTLEGERVLATLRETWPEAFGETWFR